MAQFNFAFNSSLTVRGTNFSSFLSVMGGQAAVQSGGLPVVNSIIAAAYYPLTPATTNDVALPFVTTGGTWTQENGQQIQPPTSVVGLSTVLQGTALDSNQAILAYPTTGVGGPAIGFGAYVFTRNLAGTWNYSASLPTGDAEAGDTWGSSAALSGQYAAIGASSTALHSGGAVYVYQGSGLTWALIQTLAPGDLSAGDGFGGQHNNMLMVGEWLFVPAVAQNSSTGAVYIFKNVDGTWSQVQKLTGAAIGDQFGYAIASDGVTLAIGATQNATGTGYVKTYTLAAGTWTLQQTITDTDSTATTGDDFGNGLGVYGPLLVIGAPGNLSNAGAAYVYGYSGTWSQVQKLTQPAGANMLLFGQTIGAYSTAGGGEVAIGAAHTGAANISGIFFFSSPGMITLNLRGMKVYG